MHQCEEFGSSELDGLVEQLGGLPLLVEHCEAELVGLVECAKKTGHLGLASGLRCNGGPATNTMLCCSFGKLLGC